MDKSALIFPVLLAISTVGVLLALAKVARATSSAMAACFSLRRASVSRSPAAALSSRKARDAGTMDAASSSAPCAARDMAEGSAGLSQPCST